MRRGGPGAMQGEAGGRRLLAAARVGVRCSDWRDAVRQAGALLAEAGLAAPEYAAAMVRVLEEFGPYAVVAPGICLAHARPEQGALGVGAVALSLAEPVPFGHPEHDPVWLVVGLAARHGEEHLELIRGLAEVLSDPARIGRLRAAADDRQLLEAFAVPAGEGGGEDGPCR